MPVGQRAQLLESLGALYGDRLETGKRLQERRAVRIDAEVPVDGQARRYPPDSPCKRVTRVRNRRAAEIERVAGAVEDDFHDVRIGELSSVADRVAGGRHLCVAMARQRHRNLADQRRLDQRLIALHVDDDSPGPQAPARGNLCNAVGPGFMVLAGDHRCKSVSCDRLGDSRMVGCHHDVRRAAGPRAFGDVHHHGLAVEVGERLARKPGGSVARGDDDHELHAE